MKYEDEFRDFASQNKTMSKGALALMIYITRQAQEIGLPLDAEKLLAESKGQVAGLSKSAVQTILGDHGIRKVLAEEGGRTSRGSVGLMNSYVVFLNNLREREQLDMKSIENWWIERIKEQIQNVE